MMLTFVPPVHQFVIDPRDLGNGYMATARAASRFTFAIDTRVIKEITQSNDREINLVLIKLLATEYQRVLANRQDFSVDDITIKWNGVQQNASVDITVVDAKSIFTIETNWLQNLEEIRHNISLEHINAVNDTRDAVHVLEFVRALETVSNLNHNFQDMFSVPGSVSKNRIPPIFRMPYGVDMVGYMRRLCNTFHYVSDISLQHHMKYLLMKELKRHYMALDEPICIRLLAVCETFCRGTAQPHLAPRPSAANLK